MENQEKPSTTTVSNYIEDSQKTTAKPSETAKITDKKPTTQAPVTTPKPTTATTVADKTNTKPIEKPTLKPTAIDPKPSEKTDVLVSKGDVGMGKGTSVGIMPLYETVGPNSEHLLTSAPKQKGTYYKIQILATKDFSANEPRYRSVRDLGRMDTEYIVGKGLNRVLLADFFVYEDVERLLPQIQQNKEFKTAYIVKYQDGQRIGTGK